MLVPENPDASVIGEVVEVVSAMRRKRHVLFIVVGGGHWARVYMNQARKLKLSKTDLDEIGIQVTRLNALVLAAALKGMAEPEPPKTIESAIDASFRDKIPVMGGTEPGHTTDAVAAMLAKASGSELLVVFSDVDGIYTQDPKLDPKAKKIRDMSTEDLVAQFGKKKREPGMKLVVDPVAAQLIHRYKIRTLVLGRQDLKRMPDILEGAEHGGTKINPVVK